METWILVMFSVSLMFSLLMCHAGKRSKQVSTESTASLPSYLSYRAIDVISAPPPHYRLETTLGINIYPGWQTQLESHKR